LGGQAADELTVKAISFDYAERKQSFEIIADLRGAGKASPHPENAGSGC